MRHHTAAAALLAGSLALVAGCGDGGGGGDAVDARTWAEDVCSTVRGWTDETQAASAELRSGEAPETPREARDLMVGFLTDMADSGDRMVEDLEATGVPDVDRGEEAREAVVSASREIVDGIRASSDEFEQLDPESPNAEAEFRTALTNMEARLDAIDEEPFEGVDPELDRLFDELPDCRAVAGGGR